MSFLSWIDFDQADGIELAGSWTCSVRRIAATSLASAPLGMPWQT